MNDPIVLPPLPHPVDGLWHVLLDLGARISVPRPTLLAAIVGKAAATALPGPARHYRDLALLLGLVVDPFDLHEQITSKDRKRLQLAHALLEESHPAWGLLPASARADGLITYGVLTKGA